MNSVLSAVLKATLRRAQPTRHHDHAEAIAPTAASDVPSLWAGARTPFLIFLLLSAAIGIIGYFTYAYQKQVLQMDKQAELTAIADTKVRQIADWMNERRGDARALSGDPFLAQAVQRCLQDDQTTTVSAVEYERLLARLDQLKETYDYGSVALLDLSGKPLVCAGDFPEDPHLQQLIQQVLHSGDIVVFDLHRDEPTAPIEITVLAPLKLVVEQAVSTIGIITLRIAPERHLYPLIQTWPLPSRSAETLLVRAEGDEVVFLNDLRHRQNTALNLRQPLSAPQLPAAKAARGQQGLVQGLDYRQVPVLAAIRAVSGTPWFLVAKVDIAEIYAPIQQTALLASLLVGIFIMAAGIGVIFWWRQQHALFLAEHFRDEMERKALVQHFDYLARYANDIVLLTDTHGRLVDSNDRALAAYGLSRDEIRQRTLHDLHKPGRQAQIDEQLALIKSSGSIVYETLHQRRDGSVFPVEVSARAIRIDEQQFFQHIIRDITERNRLIKRTERQTRILNTVLSATPDLVWMQDRAGLYLYGNAAALRAVNLQQGDKIVGKTGSELGLPAAMLDASTAQLQQVFATGCGSTHQITLATATGTRHYEYTFSPITGEHDAAGDIYAVVTTARDLTDRINAEQALRESELRFRTFMDHNPAIAFIKDQHGQYLYGNRAWAAQFNKPLTALLGKTDADLYPEVNTEEFRDNDRVVYGQGKIVERLEAGCTADGQAHWWTVIKFPLSGPAGQPLIGGLALDVTARRQAEEQLKQRQAEQAHVNRVTTLGEMASGMAHELNQPLTAIAHYCDAALMLLRSGATPTTEKLAYALTKAAEQALRAGEIVRHLRDFVRKDTTGRESLDFNALVVETVEFVAAEARFQDVTTEFTLSESIPELVGDRIQLQQVLVNLLHNAIEAMEQAASSIRRLAISTQLMPESRIQVTVQDTGPGLAPEIAESLFQRFQTTKTTGIGLGLSISRSIIEDHGGRLWAEPNQGQGAIFHFTLPLRTKE